MPNHNPKVRADIEVTCYTYEGIDAVKDALIAGKAVGDERTPIQIKLIAPPRYVMDTMTLDKDLGKSVLEKAIEVVTQTIVASGGKLEVRSEEEGSGRDSEWLAPDYVSFMQRDAAAAAPSGVALGSPCFSLASRMSKGYSLSVVGCSVGVVMLSEGVGALGI